MLDNDPFKICVIGTGGIAHSQHGPAYARYAAENPRVELAACCDLDGEKAAGFALRFGFRRVYTDYVEMLEVEKPHAACLHIPPDLIAPLAGRILRLGVPLLLEKPPGLTVSNRRFTPLAAELKRWLAGMAPNAIQHIGYDFFRVGREDPDFSTTAIHGIDTVRFLAGCDYQEIRFRYQTISKATNFYLDSTLACGATARLSFLPLSGVVLECATVHLVDQVFFLNLPLGAGIDAGGRLEWVQKGQVVRTLSGADLGKGGQSPPGDFELNGFWDEDASFFDDIRAGRRPACDLRHTRQSVEIAQALRERWEGYPRILSNEHL
jgi:predicted dehydrogenase